MTDLYELSLNEIRTQRRIRDQITAKATVKWLLCTQETLRVDVLLEAVDVEVCLGFPMCLRLRVSLIVPTSLPVKILYLLIRL